MELHEHNCCDMQRVYKGTWTPEEDAILTAYMEAHGNESRSWKDIATNAGLRRCGKSCRFRWLHYLRPSLDHRSFSVQEVELICNLQRIIGNKWTEIAKFLPGRSDNSIKNFWNAYCKEPCPSLQHLPLITSTLTKIFQEPPISHQLNPQDFQQPSISYDLAPLPESFPSPVVNTPMLEFGAIIDYSLFNDDNSSGWIDPRCSGNQVLEQPAYYLESNYVCDLLGTQGQNHLMGNSSFGHVSRGHLNLNNHDLLQSEEANTSNNPAYGYSRTHVVAQATDWGIHNSHGFNNAYGEINYPLDPHVPFNHHHGTNF